MLKQDKLNNMNITVKKTDLKKIHDVACESWKIRITDYAMRNPFGDSVELKQEDIKNMFDAAIAMQGLLACRYPISKEDIARESVSKADELLKALEKYNQE